MGRKELFTKIYEDGIWNDNLAHIPRSGPGSTLKATVNFREYLDQFCETKQIDRIVDIGCGDLTWMPSTKAFSQCKYIGIDIAAHLLDQHKLQYPQHTFLNIDAITEEIPGGDLAVVRDITFHMTHDELSTFLTKIKGLFRYFFITSCTNLINEPALNIYNFHEVNLFIAPFRFRDYVDRVYEPEFKRFVYLFTSDQIRI